ncbi:4-hydroxy-tetrahydrodipicolinate synthase [Rhizobium sp. S163]|uniref:4-hydroxy-tetrahydrodipicolinate synthase n=1 Tax=Rhizobium sp. S163 TaxID=3055039 RepID=UPI0025AA1BB0|nr:4-hydroxy-tetrahydrodipicolinate synthase [Rhizobium sp. S163]MDM9645193.1 4-hydroxy-tetrahydrodipicolinate synthase [Rhizobium sp. S163]
MRMDTRLRLGTVITALVTPFRNDRLDLAMLERLAERQINSGIDGLAVCTVTGEGPTLSLTERAAIIRTCVRVAAGRVPIIAATGTNATSTTIALTLEARKLGADAALVTVPYYSKPGQKGIVHHFEQVATASDLPVIIDDCPSHCASSLAPESLEALAPIGNILGVVHSSGEGARLAPRLRQRFVSLSSDDGSALSFLAWGGDCMLSSGANVEPRLFASLHRSAKAGNVAAAMALHDRLQPLIRALVEDGSPAPVKYALHVLLGTSPDVRLPMVGLDAAEKAAVFAALTGLAESRRQARAV